MAGKLLLLSHCCDIKVNIKKAVKQVWQNFWNLVPLTNTFQAVLDSTAPWPNPSAKREDVDTSFTHSYIFDQTVHPILHNLPNLCNCHTLLFYYAYYIKYSQKILKYPCSIILILDSDPTCNHHSSPLVPFSISKTFQIQIISQNIILILSCHWPKPQYTAR